MQPLACLLVFVIGCLLPGHASALSTTRIAAPATISAVTIYQDRAQVTRTATVQLKPGSQIIALEGLPVLLQDDSVRVDAKGTARVTITGIECKESRAGLPERLYRFDQGGLGRTDLPAAGHRQADLGRTA